MILECKVIHYHEIGLHTHFVGEVLDVKIEEETLTREGNPDIKRMRPIVFSPQVAQYHGIGRFIGKAFEIGKRTKPNE